MTNDLYADWDGAYVLGSLSSVQRADFERHLRGCDSCAASVRALQPLPGLLAQMSPADWNLPTPGAIPVDVSPVDAPPPTLLPRLLGEVRAARRRRRWIAAGVAAAVAASVIALSAIITARGGADPPRPVAMRSVGVTALTAKVQLDDVRWGTRITLFCRYDGGSGYPGGVYAVFVRDRGGTSRELGSWKLGAQGETRFQTGTDLTRSQITDVQIRTFSGRTLLTLPL